MLVWRHGEYRTEGDAAAPSATLVESVVIEAVPAPRDGSTISACAGPVAVGEATWQRIAALARSTCVPASEASRTRGAGAGLREND